MRAPAHARLVATIVSAGLLVGCVGRADYSAQFVRYEDVTSTPRVAVVAPIAQSDDRQLAYTDLGDLTPGETLTVRYVGKDWDTPQWSPERVIVGRAAD